MRSDRRKHSGGASGGRLVVGGVASLLIIGLVVLLIIFVLPKFSLWRAEKHTVHELLSWVDDNTSVVSTGNKLLKQLLRGDFRADVNYRSEGLTVNTGFGLGRRSKVISGTASVLSKDPAVDVGFTFAANKRTFVFSLPGNSYEVYGFKYRDLAKKYRSSVFGKLFPYDFSNSSEFLSGLFKENRKSDVEQVTDSSLRNILKHCEVKKLDKRDISINGSFRTCTVYRVQIADSSETLKDKLSSGNGLSLKSILRNFGPSVLCFVNDKHELVGADFTMAGIQYLLLLEGNDNPWERITLTQRGIGGADKQFVGGTETGPLSADIYLKDDVGDLFRVSFNKDASKLAIWTRSLGTVFQGSLIADGSSMSLGFDLYPGMSNAADITLSLSALKENPVMLAKNYTDVFKMNLGDLQRILLGYGIKLF